MISYKTNAEIELMREAALMVSRTLTEVAKILKPGVTSNELDKLIGTYIRDNGGIPSFLNYHGYPFNSCISVNDVVVHGFPNDQPLKEGDIMIQEHTEKKYGYGVVRELVGHGLGRHLHEDPQVPNYGRRGSGQKLKEGIVLAIEPMINLGKKEVFTESDGWTVRTIDRQPSVHFEHDVAVRKNKADILSDYSIIEAAEKANSNLFVAAATEEGLIVNG
jgi:methionyl aminopeptidase